MPCLPGLARTRVSCITVVVLERAQNKPFGLKRRAGDHALSLPSGQQDDPRTPLVGTEPFIEEGLRVLRNCDLSRSAYHTR